MVLQQYNLNMKKVVFHEFDPVIYPFKVWVVITDNEQIVKNRFCEPDNKELDIELKGYGATTSFLKDKSTNKKGVLIAFNKRRHMDMNTIAHESSHAAKIIFEKIGAEVAPHEPLEYLLGWIAECCDKVRRNKPD